MSQLKERAMTDQIKAFNEKFGKPKTSTSKGSSGSGSLMKLAHMRLKAVRSATPKTQASSSEKPATARSTRTS